MTAPAAISGTFADFKLIKTRSAAQVIVEVPIESADEVLKVLGGVPQPGNEMPVALARLESQPEPVREKQKFEELKRSQQAGILCNEKRFWTFLEERHGMKFSKAIEWEKQAATKVRQLCNVNSRAQFDTNETAAAKWDTLYSEYIQWSRGNTP